MLQYVGLKIRDGTFIKYEQIVSLINVYCPECPPGGGTIGHPGGQQKKFCRSVTEGTWLHLTVLGLQNKSFQDRDKKGLNPFGIRKMTRASGPIHYAPTDPHGA